MASLGKIVFSDICINGFRSIDDDMEGTVKECAISQHEGRYCLLIKITDVVVWEVDIRRSLAELHYSKWDPESDIQPIIDFTITVGSVPSWMLPYTTAPPNRLQWIFATLKSEDSRTNYDGLITNLVAMLSELQWKPLDHMEALGLWKTRCSPRRSKSTVKALNIQPAKFQSFSAPDLDRLKNNQKWLSDTHVTFALLDSYQRHKEKNVWGDLKILLLDTNFWTQMSVDPSKYNERVRARVNLVGYDFVVMPMCGHDHWWLGIIEKPAEFLEGNSVFHILDSMPGLAGGATDVAPLQNILLKHFEGATFEEGRITTNCAQVPRQPNTHDCGCFLIYFAQTFFSDPEWTLSVMKKTFSSLADRLAAWGLETDDLSFVRTEMRSLLLKYMQRGDAVVEYKK